MNNNILHLSGNQFKAEINPQNHTTRIWMELARGFDEYHILARATDNRFHCIKKRNITLHLVPKLWRSSSSFCISSFYALYIVKKCNIKKILLQSSVIGGFTGVLIKKIYRIPLLTEIHGYEYFNRYQRNYVLRYLRDLTFRYSDRIRSLSPLMTQDLDRIGFREHIMEVYNRVDLTIFSPPKESFNPGGEVRLVSVGRFCQAKNYEYLLSGINSLEHPYHLYLVGGGPLRSKYEQIIAREKLGRKVTLIDWCNQKELTNLLSSADIYIQSSISEGVPRTIIEAMGMRLPIVSTNVGGIRGVLNHGVNALLCPPSSPELFDRINELCDDRDLCIKLANTAYKDVLEKYEWKVAFAKYHQFLKS